MTFVQFWRVQSCKKMGAVEAVLPKPPTPPLPTSPPPSFILYTSKGGDGWGGGGWGVLNVFFLLHLSLPCHQINMMIKFSLLGPDLEFVKKLTHARFLRIKFYLKERKLRQMANCEKNSKKE